jgi:hypothetical protein
MGSEAVRNDRLQNVVAGRAGEGAGAVAARGRHRRSGSPRRTKTLFGWFVANHAVDAPSSGAALNRAAQSESLVDAFAYPQGAGFIGPGADALLRTALTEALVRRRAHVLLTRSDLDRLFGPGLDRAFLTRLSPCLTVVSALEDAVLCMERPVRGLGHETVALWFVTPGPDVDVVHQAVRRWPAGSLATFSSSPWPYGPTYLVDTDGSHCRTCGPRRLLSREQALVLLRQTD